MAVSKSHKSKDRNAMSKRIRTKIQTVILKTLRKKQKIDKHDPN